MDDSEARKKRLQMVAFWFIGTVLIVFAAITMYFMFLFPEALTFLDAIRESFPVWGGSAAAAVIIFAIYALVTRPKSE